MSDSVMIASSTKKKDTLRLETFSDGIFCIAITLLSIEIGVEMKTMAGNKELLHILFEQWPICLAYVISFVNVLLSWIGHHELFKQMNSADGTVMITNGILLMLIALVPFPTKTLGLFLLTDALQVAVIFYAGYFVIISLAFRLLWWAISRNPENLSPSVSVVQIRKTTRTENLGLLLNAVILGVAFLSPGAALVLSFVMWIYWVCFA